MKFIILVVAVLAAPAAIAVKIARPPKAVATINPDYTLSTCTDANCVDNCLSTNFTQGVCIENSFGNGTSYAACYNDGLVVSTYPSSDCTGFGTIKATPGDMCAPYNSGYQTLQCAGDVTPITSVITFVTCQPWSLCYSLSACQAQTLPTNKCLSAANSNYVDGASYVATCTEGLATLTSYTSADCSGPSSPYTIVTNVCSGGSSSIVCGYLQSDLRPE